MTYPLPFDPKAAVWMDQAACRYKPAELFFPAKAGRRLIAEAAAICRTCPVIEDCRTYSRNEKWGVWAGEWRG